MTDPTAPAPMNVTTQPSAPPADVVEGTAEDETRTRSMDNATHLVLCDGKPLVTSSLEDALVIARDYFIGSSLESTIWTRMPGRLVVTAQLISDDHAVKTSDMIATDEAFAAPKTSLADRFRRNANGPSLSERCKKFFAGYKGKWFPASAVNNMLHYDNHDSVRTTCDKLVRKGVLVKERRDDVIKYRAKP